MKYLVFANRVDIDNLIHKGVATMQKSIYPYEVMTVEVEKDYIQALAKVEQYGSFSFISEKKYNELKCLS